MRLSLGLFALALLSLVEDISLDEEMSLALSTEFFRALFSTLTVMQNPNAMSLTDFLSQVDFNFPKLVSVRLESDLARAKLQEKSGAFDPVFSFGSDFLRYNPSSAPGKAYETQMTETSVDVLDRSGAKLQIGARLNNGRVKSPGTSTGAFGEYFVGAKIPLIRDRLINTKTIAEKQAILGVPLADQFIRQTRFEILQKAGEVYWDWVGAGEKLRVNKALLDIAKDRAEFVRKRVASGANPPIDNDEALAEVFRRQGSFEKAERDLQKAELKLQIFLWDREIVGAQKTIERTLIPYLPTAYNPSQTDLAAAGQASALNDRPELLGIQLSRDIFTLDLELARNERKPALDLNINPGTDVGADGIGLTYKVGVFYSLPLRQNTADGKIKQVGIKLAKLDLEEKQTRQGIQVEILDAVSNIQQSYQRVIAAEQELSFSRRLERGERIRWEQGTSTLFLVNQRERGRAEAEIRFIDVRVELEQAYLNYQVTTTQLNLAEKRTPMKQPTNQAKPDGANRG